MALPEVVPESHGDERQGGEPSLVRGLSAWDATLLTIGAVVGTGIFLTTPDMARVLPHPGLILLVWLAGGVLTVTGALTYAELGVMFPRAGGLYHYLKEAYGPLTGFLYGWTAFLVIMSGGVAAIAVGFGMFLGSFLPWFSTGHVLLAVPVGGWTWTLTGAQVAAVLAIVVLTAVNHLGLKEGAWVQDALTVLKVGAIVVFAGLGLLAPAPAAPDLLAPVAAGGGMPLGGALFAAFGVAMIAALWTYDGWYGLTCSAGEVRRPGRDLPVGLIGGTLIVTVLYMLMNLVYLRALPIPELAGAGQVAEAAAGALFGPTGARLMAAAVVVSAFGCLSSTILYTSRVYHPMAQDGLFFPALGAIHPRFRTPVNSLWAQSAWAVLLTVSGTYEQLYTYVIFSSVLFHAAAATAVFVFRRTRPEAPRPYRVWGYPVVPAAFILACLLLIGNTLAERPRESFAGLGLLALGLPVYALFRRRSATRP